MLAMTCISICVFLDAAYAGGNGDALPLFLYSYDFNFQFQSSTVQYVHQVNREKKIDVFASNYRVNGSVM